MLSDLGHFSLVLAFTLSIIQSLFPLVGSFTGNKAFMSMARPAAQAQFILILFSFITLCYAFLTDDFSILYVANHSNTAMPDIYKVSAVWGAHEGSLLLWVLMLSGWGFAVSIFSKSLSLDYIARVLSIMGMVSIGFLSFMLLTSNPFQELFPIPAQGRELNPLLQDPGLAIHPPMLYMGYVGFSVAFAFALAALLGGRLDAAWARWSRPWTTAAWIFLTIGIGLGSWWAYYELGWGGWWFWDPVENASFMPWLIGTALIHSLSVTEKRGTFKAWTVLLAILAFSLSLLGTFLVRSGVLTSVHAFASDPERGQYILLFLGIVIGGSLAIYAWRGYNIRSRVRFVLFSREGFMLINNVLLVVVTAAVLLGTLAPLIADAFLDRKLSIGKVWFDTMFVALMIPLLIAMPLGPLLRWKKDNPGRLPKAVILLFFATIAALVVSLIIIYLAFADDPQSVMAVKEFSQSLGMQTIMDLALIVAGFSLALWNAAGLFFTVKDKFKNRSFNLQNIRKLGRSFHGMFIAHLGILVFIIGVTVASNFKDDIEEVMHPGETVTISNYNLTFVNAGWVQGPNYSAMRGEFILSHKDVNITYISKTVQNLEAGEARKIDNPDITAMMYPEKRLYESQMGMPMTEAAIDTTPFRDIYISMGDKLDNDNNEWIVRIYYKPFQFWLWLGVILMGLGGLLATLDKRYRQKQKQTSEADTQQQAKELMNELLQPSSTTR